MGFSIIEDAQIVKNLSSSESSAFCKNAKSFQVCLGRIDGRHAKARLLYQ